MTTLDSKGYFQRDGRRIIPVGVNYWPASSGVEMWARWDPDEIRRDLDIVRGIGLDCVRFFLRWPDFEPSFGNYDEAMFGRLRDFLGWCRERGILAHPCMVVGFMSGGYFWPADKGGRNLYADPAVRAASAAFCAKAAATMRPFADTILGLDLGNELDCADAGASPAEIERWCREVTDAIRAAWPDVLIVSGLDSSPVMRECNWHIDAQPGTDFLSVHNYPVPEWNVVEFDGMTDPLCHDILPLNTLIARAFGPVMLQEFSTIISQGAPECESYLQPVVRGCRENGANGFLWWCLHDISAPVHPYDKSAFERRLGIVGKDGMVKPSLRGLVSLLREIAADPSDPPRHDPAECVGLYLPREIYGRDNPFNPGNDLSQVYCRLLAAYHILKRIGRNVMVVRGDLPIPEGLGALLVAGAALTGIESRAIAEWVAAGGSLLWSGADWRCWTEELDAVTGATPVDMRRPSEVDVELFGRTWKMDAASACGVRTVARETTADVVARSGDGLPAVFAHRYGRGACVTTTVSAEGSVIRLGARRAERDEWRAWFEGVLGILEGM